MNIIDSGHFGKILAHLEADKVIKQIEDKDSFERESSALMNLYHQNIVKVYNIDNLAQQIIMKKYDCSLINKEYIILLLRVANIT